jgi:hypothetical protein
VFFWILDGNFCRGTKEKGVVELGSAPPPGYIPYFSLFFSVLRIRIGFSADSDPAFLRSADPDPGSQTNADPDPGQTLPKF